MATIRLRLAPRRGVAVDVRGPQCPRLACFWLARHTTRSAAGASGCSSRTSDAWECGRREQTGCPPHPQIAMPARYVKRGGTWREASS